MKTDFIDNDELENVVVNYGDEDYDLYLDERLIHLQADECLEVLLKAYAELGFCNPVYAILTGGIQGPVAVGIEP